MTADRQTVDGGAGRQEATDSRASPSGSRTSLMFVAVLVAATIPYLNSLSNGFALDDVPIIQQNTNLHSLTDVWGILTAPYWPVSGVSLGLYRPLTSLLFAVQWVTGEGEPWVFHAFAVTMHAVASCLVLGFLLSLLSSPKGRIAAFSGALCFAVHPVHTEAVANIVGQAEVLAAAFVIAACWVHAARPRGVRVGPVRLVALLVLYLLGICAKEHAIVLPALLVLIDLAQRRLQWNADSLASYAAAMSVPLLGLASIGSMFLAARVAVLGTLLGGDANPALPYLRGDSRIWNALRAWPEFYRLLVFPLDLSVDYSPGVILPADGATPMVLLGAVLLIATAVAAVRPDSGLIGLAAGWLLVAILPVSNLLFPIGVLVAERTLYLPSVAVSIALATVVANLDLSRARQLVAVGVIVLLGLAGRTSVRNPVWRSTATVQASLMLAHPESYRAQWAAAARALRLGDEARARAHYMLGYEIYDQDPIFVAEIGNFHIGQGDLPDALPYLRQAREQYGNFPRAQIYSAYVFNRTGAPDSALALLNDIPLGSRDMMVNYHLIQSERARAFEGLGNFARAAGVWGALARAGGGTSWLYHAMEARALARGAWSEHAKRALANAHANATAPDVVATIDALSELIASGCFAKETCEADPLDRWTQA